MSQLQDRFHLLFQFLRAKTATLSLAESCTGGLLSSQITSFAGVSDLFIGSVVSYANSAKSRLLAVQDVSLQTHGAVSEVVAREMATGVRTALQSTYSLSITGIAGPSGGTAEKPVGTVCFAVSGPDFVKSETKYFKGSRHEIQNAAADYALDFILSVIK